MLWTLLLPGSVLAGGESGGLRIAQAEPAADGAQAPAPSQSDETESDGSGRQAIGQGSDSNLPAEPGQSSVEAAGDSASGPPQSAENPAPETDSGAADATPQPPASGDHVILRDLSVLPEPVRRTWQGLVDVARSGDIERLRPIIEAQTQPPTFAFAQVDEPIEYLKSLSGDPAGREVLAILLEILETGFVHVDTGTENEMYLWPYFARYPVSRLTPQETVEMFTILTAGDYQDMVSYGAYIFFRVGIGVDGTWHFFVAGD